MLLLRCADEQLEQGCFQLSPNASEGVVEDERKALTGRPDRAYLGRTLHQGLGVGGDLVIVVVGHHRHHRVGNPSNVSGGRFDFVAMLERPDGHDVASNADPDAHRLIVGELRLHDLAAQLFAVDQPVDALQVEPEVRLGARLGQRGFLGLASAEHPLVLEKREGRDKGSDDHPDHCGVPTEEQRGRHRGEGGDGAGDE